MRKLRKRDNISKNLRKLHTDLFHPGRTAIKRQLASTDPMMNYNKIITEKNPNMPHVPDVQKQKRKRKHSSS
jgi:hypothetical protein